MKLIFPTRNDVRWKLIAAQLTFITYALATPAFGRTVPQFLAALVSCVVVDVVFLYRKKLPLFPLSGILHAAAITLLCVSSEIWPYAAIGAMSSLSKHLIRIEKRHIFVPNIFGIVLGLLFFPEHVTTSTGGWGGNLGIALLIFGLGLFIAAKARRIALALSYQATFVAGILLRSFLLGIPLGTVGAPYTGAAFHLFSFFIITDPVVTPKTVRHQMLFGLALGVLDTLFRMNQVKYAPLYSLLIVCAAYAWVEESAGIERDYPWSLKTLSPGQ